MASDSFSVYTCPYTSHLALDQTVSLLHVLFHEPDTSSVMPAYYLQDCHYFYRTALRGLSICTSISPLYA